MDSGTDSPTATPDANPEASADAESIPDASTTADAGNPFPDAGPLGDPPWVPITVLTTGTCPVLTPCGGDVTGTWDVSGACIEVPIESALAACPGAMITRREGRGRGRVIFGTSPMIARRIAQSEAVVEMFVPALCATPLGGCPGLQTLLQRVNAAATCSPTPASDCNCSAGANFTINDTDTYSTMNNEITSASSSKRWAYCIAENTLRYRDTSPSEPREPGTISLTRR